MGRSGWGILAEGTRVSQGTSDGLNKSASYLAVCTRGTRSSQTIPYLRRGVYLTDSAVFFQSYSRVRGSRGALIWSCLSWRECVVYPAVVNRPDSNKRNTEACRDGCCVRHVVWDIRRPPRAGRYDGTEAAGARAGNLAGSATVPSAEEPDANTPSSFRCGPPSSDLR